ncbi:MAG: DUF1049 domain-containing protein [Rhizobiales bacterium]|nr:DUF1049 domain-containing protein [Hyphomicrobiales bacterium]
MRKLLNAIVIVPLALIFLAFAVANRQFVTLSFDPFNSGNPAVALTLPLFIVIIAVAMLGVVAGSIATWFGQRHWRRAARRHDAEAREARQQLADLRAQGSFTAASRDGYGATLVPPARLPPAEARGAARPLAIGQDKPGVTL